MKNFLQISLRSSAQTFTPNLLITLFSILVTQQSLAQLRDEFHDGNFTENPSWSGDTSRFTVKENQLVLNAPAEAGVAYLSAPSILSSNAVWECRITIAFNPSSTNYARFYLIADHANLQDSLNGYFVKVGGAEDDISLYRQEGKTLSRVIDGQDGRLNASGSSTRIKVVHDDNGWHLYSALTTNEYMLEGTALSSQMSGTHTGVVCYYTSTRSDKFSFDDFIISADVSEDEVRPSIVAAEILDDHTVKLVFTESVDVTSAQTLANYQVAGIASKIQSAMADGSSVVLGFSSAFQPDITFSLTVAGIADLFGNVMAPTEKSLIFIKETETSYKDVTITEIMADPTPTVGLPEIEYIEIFNRTQGPLDITGWTISDGSTVVVLPEVIMPPSGYLALVGPGENVINFEHHLLPKFPSLGNTSDVVVLKNDQGLTVDSVRYSDSWYGHKQKAEGGWSLELIDPENLCGEGANWSASEDENGGSPGRQNSVNATKPDLTPPSISFAVPIDPFHVMVYFNEKLDALPPQTSSFEVIPGISVANAAFSDPSLTRVKLTLLDALQPTQTYTLSATGIRDCTGNTLVEPQHISFGLPEAADSLDILVNEILFNPTATGTDFVEMLNASTKFINLKGWSVANYADGVIENKTTLLNEDILLRPGEILAISEDSETLRNEYISATDGNFLQVLRLPSFPDDHGSVALVDSVGAVINFFSYDKDMHSTFLKNDEGVSLERISLLGNSENWKSAASSVGYATPGYQNSNVVETDVMSASPVSVEPGVFNPLSVPSFTRIRYAFDHSGYIATVRIFDSQGRIVKNLANNILLASNGYYRWDGDRDDGAKANVGYYMVSFEVFDEHGKVKYFRTPVAVAATF